MSLATQNVGMGNAVSSRMAWTPPVSNHGHQHAAGQSCSSDFPPSILAPSSGNSVTRGELSGDMCTTIDLFCNTNILAAVWSEERNQCTLINDKTQAIVNLSASAVAALSQSPPSLTDVAPNDIVIGRKNQSDTILDTYFPVSELNNFNGSVSSEHEKLTLEALIAPLISFTEQSVSSKPIVSQQQVQPEEGKSAKKSKKAKKVKKNISLVTPCGYDQNQISKLILASSIADYNIRGMFNRGVAAVAGALYRSPRELSNYSSNKQDLFFILDDFASRNKDVDPIVFYFNVYSLPPSNSVLYYDAALIRAEGCTDAKELGNLLGFERLCTVATLGGSLAAKQAEGDLTTLFDVNDATSCAELMSVLLTQLLHNSKTDKDQVVVVMTEGILYNVTSTSASPATNRAHACGSTNHCTADVTTISTTLGTASHCAVIKCLAQDAVMGGCLLSAAELDSSKQYIQVNDVWKIAYQLPVADGVLQAVDIAIDIQWAERPGDKKDGAANSTTPVTIDAANIEVLFHRGQRVLKADIGPVKPNSNLTVQSSQYKTKLEWGPLYFNLFRKSAQKHKAVKGYPKVHILQRVAASRDSDKHHDKPWTVLKTITPLVARDHSEGKYDTTLEPVEYCNLTISISPSTGIIEYYEAQGRTVKEVRSQHRGWVSLILLLASPFIAYALWCLYCNLHERYVSYQHAVWLRDFYIKHAPEKLKDPEYVDRTLRKYKDRMFLLWRGLEKTYKVKVPPPFSIIDNAAGIEL